VTPLDGVVPPLKKGCSSSAMRAGSIRLQIVDGRSQISLIRGARADARGAAVPTRTGMSAPQVRRCKILHRTGV